MSVCPKGLIKPGERLNKKGIRPVEFIIPASLAKPQDENKAKEESKNIECTGCVSCAVICPDTAIEVYK